MQTEVQFYVTTVPSFRRRGKRLLGAVRHAFSGPDQPQVPQGLRRDVGLPDLPEPRGRADRRHHWEHWP